nr:unnamed protein product [Callosobruchus chinensis]
MKYHTSYISSNCNQTPSVADWGKNNLISYGSCNAVFIYDPDYGSGGKVTHTLVGHQKRVNSTKWISGPGITSETELVSGSTDSTVVVWSFKEGQYLPYKLEGHQSNVNIVDGLYKNGNQQDAVIVSVSMDSTMKIWCRSEPQGEFHLQQTIELGYNICIAVKLTFLPNCNELLLACSLDNSKINIYSEDNCEDLSFIKTTQLKGHENWVRGLDFKQKDEDLVLASCSQDAFIRLWRITPKGKETGEFAGIKTEKSTIQTRNETYSVYLESVLTGHEGWIYSVNWSQKDMQLLSASIDKSMVLWEYNKEAGLWLEKIRVGEVGGNTLGFYGGLFSPDGERIMAHSYHGAFHIWKYSDKTETWTPSVSVGGHFSQVVDCAWEPQGEFLYTCSADQTTRIHAPWKDKEKQLTWHEIARPQVHGHDLSCLAVISRYQFASGAEEKVIRAFEAPSNFVENFRRICNIECDEEGDLIVAKNQVAPKGASVPSLGLSNKAVYGDDNIEDTIPMAKNPYPEESHFVATTMTEPPTEETLLQNTLWPETQKLYGHGYEVYSMAASPDKKFLASACKSTKAEYSAVLLWDVSKWQLLQKLMSHTLTVVQIQFSPDSQSLLSVSRDRRWSLFARGENDKFELIATTDKSTAKHSRIIWTCAWTHDSKYFATGSRDGKVVTWTRRVGKEKTSVLGECESVGDTLIFKNESVTALAFAPDFIADKYLMAVGLDSGMIHLYLGGQVVLSLSNSDAHHLTVKRLAFRPVFGASGCPVNKGILQLASCSSDTSVKIFDIYLDKLQ